ncbi:putative Penicillin amidase [Vibrio nigripulchritudo MADA3029]|uniref:linear amide C-N hydrolase n=1 Tax=Vibrio nigripulchritudo TaxID=28173 RepID=UPI0003B1DF91|nr:linear amide C-N hydrolase [Vibrio nigripulchritudo]CCN46043.1 putative Penicillin amidase [Vibrio nigripulchritudo MADA3020]CCN54305.1 putative Penicillin amidase [Vibrio nigripulchritudo MADA3021]CCN59606.1 putative Penicillin amidase [Vibrio nigripulchritudo MADA3029]
MCTNFKIKTKHNDMIVGRSQEFSQLLGRSLMFRKAGHLYQQNLFDPSGENCKPSQWALANCQFSWKGRYGFVAMQALDPDKIEEKYSIKVDKSVRSPVATDGINTEGLYVGSLLQNAAKYPEVTDPSKGLAVTNLVDYILSACKDCADVKAKLKGNGKESPAEVQVTGATRNNEFKQHFPVHDRFGKSIVIEFIKGKVRIHDNNQYGVLTNDPDFEWHLTNLGNYANVTPVSKHNSRPGNLADIAVKNQGNGFSLVPGGQLPAHRFVRTVMMVNYAKEATNVGSSLTPIEHGVSLASHTLNTVDIPFGVIQEVPESKDLKPEIDFTQYITISDLSNRKYFVRLYDTPQLYSVDLTKLNLNELNGKTQEVPNNPVSIDLTDTI